MSICLFFTYVSPHAFASNTFNSNGNIQIIQKDSNKIIAKGEADGYEIYATYDVKTREIIMQSIEKPQSITGFSLAREKVTNYKITVNNAFKGDVDAVATEIGTNKQHKIQKGNVTEKIEENRKDRINSENLELEKVVAQIPIVIPVGSWLAAALLAALLAAAAVVVIYGLEYVLSSEVSTTVKESNYKYYYAYLNKSENKVYIGPAIDANTAQSWISTDSEDQPHDLWAKTSTLAYQVCYELTKKKPEHHDKEWENKGEGYYRHYHPVNMWGSKMRPHVWYF